MLTEAQAKCKKCPFALQTKTVANYHQDGTYEKLIGGDCIAGECMAWEWQSESWAVVSKSVDSSWRAALGFIIDNDGYEAAGKGIVTDKADAWHRPAKSVGVCKRIYPDLPELSTN